MKEELENLKSGIKINDLIRYCQGYIKLVNPSVSRFRVYTKPIDEKYFSTSILYTDIEEEEQDTFLVNLPEFYQYNPKDLPEDIEEEYNKQKDLAQELENIKNRFKISEFTKQVNINFGYFKVEIPEPESDNFENEEQEEKEEKKNKKTDTYPLFSMPIEIISDNKFYIKIPDTNVIPNLGFLYNVLGEEGFYEFSDFVNKQESEGNLRMPLKKKTIELIWEELKSKLKLSEAVFDENYFDPNHFVISLTGKSNYFLEQDYKDLSELDEEDLVDTALSSWTSDEELSLEEEVSERDGELFFPFPYNKDQVGVLSVIKNRASIVEGPPGTGKSLTISNLLCHLTANGKRVLFLSQKAQAIKVVKDYMKKLDVNYLYGYIPNRYSSLYTTEEERDGASYSLASIDQHLNSLSYSGSAKDLNQTVEKKFQLEDEINGSIGIQREISKAFDEKEKLKDYEIGVVNLEAFSQSEEGGVQELLTLDKEIIKLSQEMKDYLSKNKKYVEEKDKKFLNLSFKDKKYSECFKNIVADIPPKAFERDSLFNPIKKQLVLNKLKKHTERLPKEIYDCFLLVINEKSSRSEKIKSLDDIIKYCESKEKELILKDLTTKKLKLVEKIGLEENSFNKLKSIVEKEKKDGIKKIKQFVLTQIEIEKFKIHNVNDLNTYLHKINFDEKKYIAGYLRNIVDNNLKEITKNANIKGALARIAKSLRKSKRAYKTFDNFKNESTNFYVMREAVPIWIMDLEDVSRLIPLEAGLFDYVILDEASQCNIAYAMPALFRAKRAIFFGDSEQMRDDSIRFKTNRSLDTLAKKYKIPGFLQIKSIGDSVQSIMDIGYNRGFTMKPLTYHYRSPKEIIGFSNDNFYAPKKKKLKVINTNYLTFEDTNKVLVNHIISAKKELDVSSKSNIAEAQYICQLIEKLKKDPKTRNKSIGVLSFFANQARLLREMIKDEDVKVSIIEGIQGDEKDIIIYSLVICDPGQKRMYIPLTGEGGEINKELNMGRVNVAFSRARQQVHCVTSLPVEKWPEGIWIKKYLEYVQNNGEVNFFKQELADFDSNFEEDFYNEIMLNSFGGKYILQNQVESCGFKIDFVITDGETGKQLAIECDGPTHFTDESEEVYVESDYERQAVLESAGWTFYRLSYSDWVRKNFNKNQIVGDIKNYFENNVMETIEKEAKGMEARNISGDIVVNDIEVIKEEPAVTVDKSEKEEAPVEPEVQIESEEKVPVKPKAKKEAKAKKSAKTKATGDFNNLLEFPFSPHAKLMVSLFNNDTDLIITEYVNTTSYTGYTKKNIIVAVSNLAEFIEKSNKVLADGGEESVQWKDSDTDKINIREVDSSTIDIRQHIVSSWYTGFTKKGFRTDKSIWSKFIKSLEGLLE